MDLQGHESAVRNSWEVPLFSSCVAQDFSTGFWQVTICSKILHCFVARGPPRVSVSIFNLKRSCNSRRCGQQNFVEAWIHINEPRIVFLRGASSQNTAGLMLGLLDCCASLDKGSYFKMSQFCSTDHSE